MGTQGTVIAPTIGFIGLGRMGRPMVRRLTNAGIDTVVFSRSPGPVLEAVRNGARAANRLSEVGCAADMIATCLPTPSSVEDVYEELTRSARPGQLYIEHSTVSPDLSRACARALAARGAAYVDAPVSGGPAGAADGTLTVMVGGESTEFDRVAPVLERYGSRIRLCGPVGAGQTLKLINQLLVGIHALAAAEAAAFAEATQADLSIMLELISSPAFGASVMLTRALPRVMRCDFDGATPIATVLKDLNLILDEADRCGVRLRLGSVSRDGFLDAADDGLAQDDVAGLIRLWERREAPGAADSSS
jgi:3-hydroxyisobutyrate dehydrogenase-like beta-hydroxyacid dehydrogenase